MPQSPSSNGRTRRIPYQRLGTMCLILLVLVGFVLFDQTARSIAVVAAQVVSGPDIEIENPDDVPFTDRLITSRIQKPEDGTSLEIVVDPVTGQVTEVCCVPANKVHDVATLRIHNRGNAPLQITGVINGPWAISGSASLGATTIAPGTLLNLPVKFTATQAGTSDGLYEGSLTLTTNDADEPTVTVQLAGFWQFYSEKKQEPSLVQIVKVFGYTTDILGTGKLNNLGKLEAIGEEVLSPFWRQADKSKPITVHQIAAYHNQGSDASIYWYPKSSRSPYNDSVKIATHDGVYGQSFWPALDGGTGPVVKQLSPTTDLFGFRVQNDYSDPTRNHPELDIQNGCKAPCGHHLRFWPIRDRTGSLVKDTWLLTMDYTSINYDYQDNVYIISNMRPEKESANAASGLLPGSSKLVLDFNRAYPGSLADKDNQTVGFTSTQRNRIDVETGSNSYNKTLLDIDISGQGTLKITTTEGSNRGNDNNLVNGLMLPFDAGIHSFVVSTRLLGPLTSLDSGFRQGGIMFGPGQDNFIKLVALSSTSGPLLEFVMEMDSETPIPGSTVPLADVANLQSLDLKLYGDAKTGTVRAAYRAVYADGRDNGEVFLPQALTLTDAMRERFFAHNEFGGLLTTHKGTTAPITLAFDRFAIESTQIATGQVLQRIDTGTGSGRAPLSGWTSDSTPAKLFSPDAPNEPTSFKASEIAETDLDGLYQTYRGRVNNNPPTITYNIPIAQPQTVDLRLHFAELYWGATGGGAGSVGQRIFDVSAEGVRLLDNFDISTASGGALTATVVTLKAIKVSDGNLTLALKAEINYPAISGIEVVASVADNQLPMANAGADQSVVPGAPVVLNGARSSDPDGDALSYVWTQMQGLPVSLVVSNAQAAFAAPSTPGQLTFLLTVTDSRGGSATDTVTITVLQPGETPITTPEPGNNPPIANGGPDRTVLANTMVTLDGGASSDPDGDPLGYTWSQVQGAPVNLILDGTKATFIAPALPGQLAFVLTVNDGRGGVVATTVRVIVQQQQTLAGTRTYLPLVRKSE